MTTTSLKQLATQVNISSKYGARLDRDKQSDWQRNANGYTVRLMYKGRQYTIDFWQGTGITEDPTAAGVLDCLLSDANGGEMTVDEFCGEFGYDNDSRTAERTWKQCGKVREELQRLLGDDFDLFMYSERD